MSILRRKRLQDGSFGELEKVFSGETPQEKIERLEQENNSLIDENSNLLFQGALTSMGLQEIQDENAEMLFRLAVIEMGGIM